MSEIKKKIKECCVCNQFTVDIIRISNTTYCIEHGIQALEERVQELEEGLLLRINQLQLQIGNPEVLDQTRVEAKLEAYHEIKNLLTPPETSKGEGK